MSALPLETVELEPSSTAQAAVVWLHGLGADGHDFESLVPELQLPPSLAVRFVFPHAPVRPVTINGGHRMRAWYDVAGFDRRAAQDERGIRESAEAIGALVKRERERGIAASRILVAGFSQGGAMALFTALRWPERLGAILALSTYLPLAESLSQEGTPENKSVPIFMAHGVFDPVVPLVMGAGSMTFLVGAGYAVDWRQYPMQHSVCAQEIEDIGAWLRKILKA